MSQSTVNAGWEQQSIEREEIRKKTDKEEREKERERARERNK